MVHLGILPLGDSGMGVLRPGRVPQTALGERDQQATKHCALKAWGISTPERGAVGESACVERRSGDTEHTFRRGRRDKNAGADPELPLTFASGYGLLIVGDCWSVVHVVGRYGAVKKSVRRPG